MSTNHTTNYGLCQWLATDQVQRTDFNQDNAKIDTALEGAFLAHKLAMSGYRFPDGEGIVQPSADQTVCVTGRLGRDGMRQTDIEILNIMLGH